MLVREQFFRLSKMVGNRKLQDNTIKVRYTLLNFKNELILFHLVKSPENWVLASKILVNPLPSEPMSELIRINDARKKFKAVLNELFLNQTAFGESISQYQETVDNYLSQNVDLIRILAFHKTQPISLVWKTFLTQGADTFTTKGSNEETLAIELVMARYCFAFAYYHEAEPLINPIRDKFTLTLQSSNTINEEYTKNIDQILNLFYIGWEKIKKLHNVIKDVSKSIVLSDSYILEAKGNTLDAVKSILEANANYFYIESLRLQKDYKRMALVANGTIRRLKQAKAILQLDGKEVRADLLEFLDIAIKFYKMYGMWALMSYYEKMIDRDEYEKKEYVKVTLQMLCLAEQTLALCSEFKKSKFDKNGNIYRAQQYAAYFEPFCVKITQIYTSVHQHAPRVDGERCLAELGEEDYLEERFIKKISLSK